ncbi:MAG: hypothetical protein PHV39_04255 [Methanomicrobium sp.]|nr:hypothetical protein [Methanomicrobium sp.]
MNSKKGANKISISNFTDSRINYIKKVMAEKEPERYPDVDKISYNVALSWVLDLVHKKQILT